MKNNDSVLDIYFAGGPFHLFNIINLKMNENATRPAELVITNTWNGNIELIEGIRNAGLFNKIQILDPKKSDIFLDKNYKPNRTTLGSRLSRLLRRINDKYLVGHSKYKDYIFYNKKYSYIYVAGDYEFLWNFFARHVRNNGKIFVFDDGLGTRSVRRKFSYKEKIRDLLGFKWFWHIVSGVYFYSPEAVTARYPIPLIKQISPLDSSDNKEILKRIYKYDESLDQLQKYNIIFFSSGFDACSSISAASELSKQEVRLVNNMLAKFPEIAIKPHPLSSDYQSRKNLVNNIFPFEASLLFVDINNKVFISPFSAIIYNPIFVLQKEPYIILLYKLMKIDMSYFSISNDDFEEMNKIMLYNQYRDKSKIFIPESEDELFDILKKLRDTL